MPVVGVQLSGGGRISAGDNPFGVVFVDPTGMDVTIPMDPGSMFQLLDGFLQHGNGLTRIRAANLNLQVMWSSDPGDNSVQVTVLVDEPETTIGPIRLTLAERVRLWERINLIRYGG